MYNSISCVDSSALYAKQHAYACGYKKKEKIGIKQCFCSSLCLNKNANYSDQKHKVIEISKRVLGHINVEHVSQGKLWYEQFSRPTKPLTGSVKPTFGS